MPAERSVRLIFLSGLCSPRMSSAPGMSCNRRMPAGTPALPRRMFFVVNGEMALRGLRCALKIGRPLWRIPGLAHCI